MSRPSDPGARDGARVGDQAVTGKSGDEVAKSAAERMREYRARNRERTRMLDRARTAARRARGWREDPLKKRARNAVSGALRSGRLIRQPCEVCQAEPAEAHHDDYSRPLEVRWLCRRHHEEAHHLSTM
jgi:hypothetical protein